MKSKRLQGAFRRKQKLNRKITNRVIIRQLSGDDYDAFSAAVRRSRSLHRNWVNSKAMTRAVFEKYLKSSSTGQNYRFFVVLRATGELVGVINLNNVVHGHFQCAAAGYYAFLPHAGKGLMREGLALVLKYAFQKLKLHRVEANIQPDNRRSIALAKSCGLLREGFSRRFVKVCGRWKDHERWAILVEDLRPGRNAR
ncbi:MAG TPA: GNAT family protein [Verrucomicrobiae bacterium]|jgi:ribosomal-protein-alanine N-acetyltransferase